mgnify:CR=1 FL=1
MKKILIFFIFVIGAYFLFYSSFKGRFDKQADNQSFYESFNTIERENWFVGEWGTHNSAYSAVFIEDGVAKLPVTVADKGPYLVTKAFPVKGFEVLKIKRRAKISPGEKYFAGGMAIFETNNERLRPDAQAAMPFGNALLLVEYANGTYQNAMRPGESTFRLLTPGWQDNGNYLLIEPEFDTWITEEITMNLVTGDVIYSLNGREYTITTSPMTGEYIKIWMHSFGHFTGHEVAIDSVEVIFVPKAELEE